MINLAVGQTWQRPFGFTRTIMRVEGKRVHYRGRDGEASCTVDSFKHWVRGRKGWKSMATLEAAV